MTNVSFDVYKHIIELVMLDYSVDEISNCLNLEKSYIISMLKKIRSDIVSSMDEDSFYLIPMIDKSLGKKVKNVTRNFGGFKRNLIFGLLCDGKSYFEIINELNVSPSSYLSLLRTMYIDLYTYGSIEEKIYLPLVRNAIDEVLAEMREDGFLATLSEKYFGQDDTKLTTDILEKNDLIEAERVALNGENSDEVEKNYVVGTSGQTKPLNFFNDNNELVGLEIDIIQ